MHYAKHPSIHLQYKFIKTLCGFILIAENIRAQKVVMILKYVMTVTDYYPRDYSLTECCHSTRDYSCGDQYHNHRDWGYSHVDQDFGYGQYW